jgi:hypothetical protein
VVETIPDLLGEMFIRTDQVGVRENPCSNHRSSLPWLLLSVKAQSIKIVFRKQEKRGRG